MSTTMTNAVESLAERMEASVGARLTITKVGGIWRVTYADERGGASRSGTDPRVAAESVARELGLV